jgi:peptide-N4-(N-acetyl-beta-glucosaminyl)asparagine amidase
MATLWRTVSVRLFFLVALIGSLLLLSGNAPQPVQAQTALPNFTLVGNAVRHDDRLGLTINERLHTGGAWLPEKQAVANGFEVIFDWQITRANPQRGADGFALVIHNADTLPDPDIALGMGRHGMGYQGIPNSLAVEFDTTQTPASDFGHETHGDHNDNHISVQTRGQEPNSAHPDFSKGRTTQTEPGVPFFANGAKHTTKVVYTPGNIAVFVDDMTAPLLNVAVDLGTILRLDEGNAWVGLTGATGRRFQAHDIYTFSFTPTTAGQ